MTNPVLKRRPLIFRRLTDYLMRAVSLAALALSLAGMLWIVGTTIVRGAPVLSTAFVTESSKPYGIEPAGIANALWGTLHITLCSAAMTLPLGLAAGIWLAEFGQKSKIGSFIRFAANVMMGIPSILTGLFIYAVWVIPTGHFSGFAGSLALGIIMLPVIVRTTEESLLMVSPSLREAALALGMRRWRATTRIICPSAKSGLLTGILLSLARVSGETAPLLFTALYSDSWPIRFFSEPMANVPVLMTEYAMNSPFASMQAAGWGAALIIMTLILALNIGVRFFFAKDAHNRS